MSTELISVEEIEKMIAADAHATQVREKSAGTVQYLSIKNGRFTLGEDRLGTTLDVVIVSSAFENAYYDRPYDPDNITSPGCFAIGLEDSLSPHEDAPNKISSDCKTCPLNQWGSAATGKGKACKNSRRLLIMAYGNDGLSTAQVVGLRLPPTSIKNFATYAKSLAIRTGKPTYAVVTTLSFDETSDWPLVVAEMKSVITDHGELSMILQKKAECDQIILEPYDTSSYSPSDSAAVSSNSTEVTVKKSKLS